MGMVWYTAGEDDTRFPLRLDWVCALELHEDQVLAAQDCALDFHGEHDGWEASWPLEIALYASEDGPEIARLNVERDYDPTFMARHVPPNARNQAPEARKG